jgi:hypothetical protein
MASSPGFTGGIATPPPALQQPGMVQSGGLLEMLSRLLGGAQAPVSAIGPVPQSVAASAMPRPPERAQMHEAGEAVRAAGDEGWARDLHSMGQMFLKYAVSDINKMLADIANQIASTGAVVDGGRSVH